MSDNAKFRYSASEGTVELEGSEDFISKHIEVLTDLARLAARHVIVEPRAVAADPIFTSPVGESSSAEPAAEVAVSTPEFSVAQKTLETIQDYPAHLRRLTQS